VSVVLLASLTALIPTWKLYSIPHFG